MRHGTAIYRTARWQALRLEILRRDNFQCVQCGKRGRLEIDHIKPLRDGGAAYDPANLQSLCGRCHTLKTRQDVGLPPPDPERIKWRRAIAQLKG